MTLKDDGKGTINAIATPDKSTYNFTNEYEATGKADLKAKIAITGASWPKGGKVTFTVTAANGVPMPEKPAPETGDNTPITLYLILFLATAMIILEESIRRLRKDAHKK